MAPPKECTFGHAYLGITFTCYLSPDGEKKLWEDWSLFTQPEAARP